MTIGDASRGCPSTLALLSIIVFLVNYHTIHPTPLSVQQQRNVSFPPPPSPFILPSSRPLPPPIYLSLIYLHIIISLPPSLPPSHLIHAAAGCLLPPFAAAPFLAAPLGAAQRSASVRMGS